PGKDDRDESWPVARQLRREEELLRLHEAEWLGEAAAVGADYNNEFRPDFRRGVVASGGVARSGLLAPGEGLRRACPALGELIVFGALGRGQELASCPALAGLPALLPGWLDPEDAAALAASPHVADLRSLTVWMGGAGDAEAVRSLARLAG